MSRAKLTKIGSSNILGLRILNRDIPLERVRRSLFRLLRENHLCAISTVSRNYRAHINTAYFCFSDELEVFFLSHPSSLHSRNLSTNPSMAIAIFSSSPEWAGRDHGVQLFGTCTQATGAQARKAERLYGKRFPAYARWKTGLRKGDQARDYRFYRFETNKLKLLDEKEFGDAVFVSAAVRRGTRSQ